MSLDTKLDELKAKIAEEKTVIASVIAFIAGLAERLAAALAMPDDAEKIAEVEAIMADVDANKAALASAIVVNTPAADVEPVPAPVPDVPVETPPSEA